MNGQMKFDFTYAAAMHSEESVQQFTREFLNALREIIAHCQQPGAGGRTPSDFPLAGLEQAALDGLLKEQRDVEDIYPLSPMQTLFFSANFGLAQGSFDQWHCTLRGKLDAGSFERAWNETIRRHAVLRSTVASAGLPEPLQVVHREVRAPWTNEDWRNVPAEQQASRWDELLKQDRGEPLDLARAPAMRFKLVRLREDSWKFLWSVPAMLLDGWSWPLVFRDVSLVYESYEMKSVAQLEAVRPYRVYLEWLNAQDAEESGKFWKKQLAGFRKPTMLSGERPAGETGGERYVERVVQVSVEATNALQAVARKLKITLNTLVQGAWTLLLSRQSGETDVVFGAAFSGRPTDLPGAESIVGPFTNNLPVRMSVKQEELTEAFLRKLHSRLLELSAFQFTPLMEIQRSSEVPWRYRIFDSLLVYQNYKVDDAAKRLGRDIQIGDFAGPIHTNYPLLLLAEPGEGLRFTLIYDRKVLTASAMERWAADLVILCEMLPAFLDKQAGELQALLSAKPAHSVEPEKDPAAQWQNFVPAQTEMEKNIAKVWQKMFGLDEVNVEANFFELGGHSLLLVQMHSLLRQELKTDFPIIALFEHPTVRMLAGHLSQPAGSKWQKGEQMRERAQRQKKALAQMRGPNKK
jgi:acyl carrier protein